MNGYTLPTTEGSQTIRYPATANLMIDSDDRNFQSALVQESSPWTFQLSQNQNIQNGFFTRIAATELVLTWNIPNINSAFGNQVFIFDISGDNVGSHAVSLPTGFYTAQKAIDCLVSAMNTAVGSTLFTVVQDCSGVGIDVSGNNEWYPFSEIPLPVQLGFPPGYNTYAVTQYIQKPDLRAIKYLDFISQDLTYAQRVKDFNTTPTPQNVLQRWYMSWDDQNNLDSYGFPIYQSYTPFTSRKTYNPPKQIKYDNNLPIGNLRWEVWGRFNPAFFSVAPLLNGYAPLSQVLPPPDQVPDSSSWQMSLQLSEN